MPPPDQSRLSPAAPPSGKTLISVECPRRHKCSNYECDSELYISGWRTTRSVNLWVVLDSWPATDSLAGAAVKAAHKRDRACTCRRTPPQPARMG